MDISILNIHIYIHAGYLITLQKIAMDATTWNNCPFLFFFFFSKYPNLILNVSIPLNVHQYISQILHPNVHGKTHKCFYRFMSQFAPTEFGQCLEGMNF